MGAYFYSSRLKFIGTEKVTIVFYLFLAVFFAVYIALAVIAVIR